MQIHKPIHSLFTYYRNTSDKSSMMKIQDVQLIQVINMRTPIIETNSTKHAAIINKHNNFIYKTLYITVIIYKINHPLQNQFQLHADFYGSYPLCDFAIVRII